MSEITLCAIRDDDWPAFLDLAKLSLAEMPVAPSQAEWMQNRGAFSPSGWHPTTHFVATSGERIVGYAYAELRSQAADGWYRLFVVVEPSARATLGTMLLARAPAMLDQPWRALRVGYGIMKPMRALFHAWNG